MKKIKLLLLIGVVGMLMGCSHDAFVIENMVYEEHEEVYYGNCIEGNSIGEIAVHVPEDVEFNYVEGKTYRIYSNGMMTRSLPPQITAIKIEEVE